MAEYNNVREFVINALKQYHAKHASAEGEAIQTLLSDYATYTQSNTYYVAQEAGKGLSTNDFTTAYMTKLNGIATGAEVNVQSDWAVSDTSSDAYIANKPSLTSFFGYAYYDSTRNVISFENEQNGTELYNIDCNDFIIDGLVNNVSIENYDSTDAQTLGTSYLFIDFNTVSGDGHTDIKIPLQNIFAPNNYYTKSEIDSEFTSYNTRVTAVETAYTYFTSAYSYTLGRINDFQQAYTYLSGAYTYVMGALLDDESTWAAALVDLNGKIDGINNYGYITNAGLEASAAYTYLMNGYTYLSSAYSYTLGYIANAFNEFQVTGKEDTSNKKTSLTVAANVSDTYYPSTSAVASYVGSLAELSQSELNDIFGISNQGGE
jgi:hypothetical protein